MAAEPAAAVQEDVDRHALGVFGGALRQVDVEGLLGAGAVGNVEAGFEFLQYRLGPGLLAGLEVFVFGHPGAVVVLRVKRRLVVVSIDGGIVHGARVAQEKPHPKPGPKFR